MPHQKHLTIPYNKTGFIHKGTKSVEVIFMQAITLKNYMQTVPMQI